MTCKIMGDLIKCRKAKPTRSYNVYLANLIKCCFNLIKCGIADACHRVLLDSEKWLQFSFLPICRFINFIALRITKSYMTSKFVFCVFFLSRGAMMITDVHLCTFVQTITLYGISSHGVLRIGPHIIR